VKNLMSLWRELAVETAGWCGTSATLDVKYAESRVKEEGDGFLTITLTDFCRAFEDALEVGRVDLTAFSSFKSRGGLPLFLSGYLGQIFDTSGTLLDEPNIDCIRAVRQLTLMLGKVERKCSQERERSAMSKFVQLEEEMRSVGYSSHDELLPRFRKAATLLWADVYSDVESVITGKRQLVRQYGFGEVDPEVSPFEGGMKGDLAKAVWRRRRIDPFMDLLQTHEDSVLHLTTAGNFSRQTGHVGNLVLNENVESEIVDPTGWETLVPRHGPGATADRLVGNGKFGLAEWTTRLESVFPYGDYGLPQLASIDELDRVVFLEPGCERPVKVCAVPKTLRTPRIIAVEPACLQYMQQAISYSLIHRLEHVTELEPTTFQQSCELGRFFIGFADQEPNRFLARKGSLDGSLATLDLSEASDRVLNQHVELLFAGFPRLSEAVQATRSSKADVPGFGVIPLAKFASMGSALCFPVEAMVFVTIVIAAIAKELCVPVNRKLIHDLRGKVRVYGDDIVVPVEYVRPVIDGLEAFGLKVNSHKSFWSGKFRESCGGDYYDGEWVTPIRLRRDLPRSLADGSEVVSLVAFRNLLYYGGYWRTVRKIDEWLEVLFKGHWSVVYPTAAGLGRLSFLDYLIPYQDMRIHPRTHVPLVRGVRVRATIPESPISGSGALLKFLIKRSVVPSQDEKHLERQGRPKSVHTKLGWIRPY
jgi:hypothetical protein